MKDQMIEALEQELAHKDIGYHTTCEVLPGSDLCDASVIEIVALGADGEVIAYRYSDDSIDEDWQIGTIEDAVEACLARREEIAKADADAELEEKIEQLLDC